jgi:RNA polymerase sigma-70 factor (ECF subfamily)
VLGDRADAEDAVGDALLRGWQSAGSLRSPAEFQAWLDRILVNVCRDRLRRRARVRFIALDVEHDRPGTADEFRELAERDELVGALAALPADERIVVVLHYWADLTLEAVGQRLGWPVGTVKSKLHRALGRVREHLGTAEATG